MYPSHERQAASNLSGDDVWSCLCSDRTIDLGQGSDDLPLYQFLRVSHDGPEERRGDLHPLLGVEVGARNFGSDCGNVFLCVNLK